MCLHKRFDLSPACQILADPMLRHRFSVQSIDSTQPLVHFSCGVFAGCLASIVTQPADVIKTQMQVNTQQFMSVQQTVRYIAQVS